MKEVRVKSFINVPMYKGRAFFFPPCESRTPLRLRGQQRSPTQLLHMLMLFGRLVVIHTYTFVFAYFPRPPGQRADRPIDYSN